MLEREKVLKVKGKQGMPRKRKKEQNKEVTCFILCPFVVINYSNLINQSCDFSVQTLFWSGLLLTVKYLTLTIILVLVIYYYYCYANGTVDHALELKRGAIENATYWPW
jgi:hypothetical protein